jgi:ATP-binding cassette subfamily B protein
MSEIAQFASEVKAFPQGYATMLGERGINLSGGQRQRAALARALAIDPALLILDDALAAVDTHTEEEILKRLRKFMEGRTTLLISHRISTVSIADHILYLEAGRVAEEGNHEELMALGKRYWSLARKQQLTEEIQATA